MYITKMWHCTYNGTAKAVKCNYNSISRIEKKGKEDADVSQYLIEQYSKMIKNVDECNIKIRNGNNKKLTMQFYSRGKFYDGKLMVVGRAVNGWDKECEWMHGEYADFSPYNMIMTAYSKSLINPLQWVIDAWGVNDMDDNGKKKYNTATSPFWQLAKNVLKQITPQNEWNEESWALKIMWSNLYKIAPAIGGNPNSTLCKLQYEFCKDILDYEITQNKPEYILFVTGRDWFSGFEDSLKKRDNYNPKFLVCERPEFKSPSQMAGEISKKFFSL